MVKISIIIPVYNVEKYLDDCLNSILIQDFTNWEAICINDGSTDNSLEILNKYAKKDPRIIVISQENKGQASARNAGIKIAKGEYICFLDSDDMLKESALSKLDNITYQGNYNFIAYNTDICYESEELKNKFYKNDYYLKKYSYSGEYKGIDLLCKMIQNREYCDSVWLFLVNSKWLKGNNIFFYEGIFYEDALFATLCYLKATNVKYIDEILYTYRVRTNSTMTSKIKAKNVYSYLMCYKELLLELMNNNYDNEVYLTISKYLNQITSNLLYWYNLLDENEKEKFEGLLSSKDKLLANGLNISSSSGTINTKMYFNSFFDILFKSQKIILYGMGKVGGITYEFLKKKGIENKIISFAVTDSNSENIRYGIKVYKINDLINHKDALILITTGHNYHNEIKKKLNELGFDKYLVVDYILQSSMEKFINDIEE